ncbi:hypothetical protein QE152_g13451 [Popillia japonica]|uniref:Uncharacterized protein n=1 Tax=Popillia japonica TaxID=7064 RepID=A0AAW1LC31_POPJA
MPSTSQEIVPILSTSTEGHCPQSLQEETAHRPNLSFPTLEEIRPFEKEKSTAAKKRKRVSAILTDTPIKKSLRGIITAVKTTEESQGYKKEVIA